MRDEAIPGRATVDDWDTEPHRPLSIVWWGVWRDGWGTMSFKLRDSTSQEFHFFFDGHLGRLCSGSGTHLDDDAAFVKAGSPLMREVLELLWSERDRGTEAGLALAYHLDKAMTYSGLLQGAPGQGALETDK